MVRCGHNEIQRVGPVVPQKQRSFQPADDTAGIEYGEASKRYRDHDRNIETNDRRGYIDSLGRNHTGNAEHPQNVKDVTTDDIPHSDIALATYGGDDGGDHFG